MSERTVSITTQRTQQAHGDTLYRATVDFHIHRSDFGGAPIEEEAVRIVKALWPAARNVELTAAPDFDARRHTNSNGDLQADRWRVTGKVRYQG